MDHKNLNSAVVVAADVTDARLAWPLPMFVFLVLMKKKKNWIKS
jgi:hypothetical protein